jgi:predicted nucleic acid-binding protein
MQPQHPHGQIARRAIQILKSRNETLFMVQQNIVEFWAVTTRSVAANGLAFTTEQAAAEVNAFRKFFVMAPELPLQDVWQRLVVDHRVEGRSTHDARLVAAMLVHGIESLLTFNVQDFLRYGEIRVLDAATVV